MAVASTKAFTTQVSALYWLANRVAYEQGALSLEGYEAARDSLLVAGEFLENGLDQYKTYIFETVAPVYAVCEKFIFIGRHITYPFALEAALKLKEIAYIFSQAYPAGELKHGPLALVDEDTPVCIFSHPDPVMYQKILSNAQEIKARKGRIVAFVFEGQSELQALADHSFVFPLVHPHLSVVVMTGVMQLLMYAIAKERGCDIDRPRNLAKSVTVE
jgi:glucosamine--fructose-6-phosphate aminotransferase (isomerizing)